ncbi:MAG: glycerol kinase GlpK [Bacteroidales bacterium]
MNSYILALDQGTTSSRAIIYDHNGLPVSTAQKEFAQIYPEPGWVEHDAAEIWETQASVAREALAKGQLDDREIEAVGITNQRETTVIWNRRTGEPVYNAIVWQDRRTADFCDRLKVEGYSEMISEKTGLIIDAYFSATKIWWILNNIKGARSQAENGELAFGTIDSWLVWNLTGGKTHITDVTNASRTMLFNINTMDWDDELLKLFDIPANILPEVKSSSEVYCSASDFLSVPVRVAGIAGDQQAALFGQMCTEPGMIKNTYGTGCFLVMNIGEKPVRSDSNLLTTVAWQLGGETHYALEGSIFIAGAVVQWLRDGLGLIGSSAEIEGLASQVSDNGGVCFVPAFTGLGAPYWNQHARGTLVGVTRGTTAAHIARAALESIAFQTADVVEAMKKDSGLKKLELRVDGGAAVNDLLMQFQADILQADVVRPRSTETTALGAAYLAGLAVGYWKNIDQIREQWQADRTFTPKIGESESTRLTAGWKRAVRSALAWADDK